MFIQTIDENGNVFTVSRDKREDIMMVEDWEILDFKDPTLDELRGYEEYLNEQLRRVWTSMCNTVKKE